MSGLTKAEIKAFFETGDIPTEAQFIDLFDSSLGGNEENFPAVLSTADGGNLTGIEVWKVTANLPAYYAANQFSITGDATETFTLARSLRLRKGSASAAIYATVLDASYDFDADSTVITINSDELDSTLYQVEYLKLPPYRNSNSGLNGALISSSTFTVLPVSDDWEDIFNMGVNRAIDFDPYELIASGGFAKFLCHGGPSGDVADVYTAVKLIGHLTYGQVPTGNSAMEARIKCDLDGDITTFENRVYSAASSDVTIEVKTPLLPLVQGEQNAFTLEAIGRAASTVISSASFACELYR